MAVQQRLEAADYADLARLERRLGALLGSGLRRLPGDVPVLAAFPEDAGTLLGFAEDRELLEGRGQLASAVRALARRHLWGVARTRLLRRVSVIRALFLERAPTAHRAYVELFGNLARRYGCHLVAGSAVFPDHRLHEGVPELLPGPAAYNTSYLFDPGGRVVASQRKVHLVELEAEGNLDLTPAPAETLSVVPTPVGRVGIAICYDAFHPDVRERLREQGVQVLVQPSANPKAWDDWQRDDWARGSWQAVLEGGGRPLYAVNPMMVGSLFDLAFEGQSGIFTSRRDLGREEGYAGRPARPGVVALARGWTGAEVLAAALPHPDELDAAR
ncbi:carbon-nitrogen hydrolase family protein [Limnochorda pilosa]|uniref:Nitrilase/cyanide hydratase and apolipoprotein N-acyltransferase n=1 Tax=Limnochorda pilosa TaxID=1555112 RepID=A0A0K2SJI3_LIMPI|nr:carbon-nitrogen hydrolase family protein [Limnochorda pilosa]BAS27271.1 nitrilase/cyanide hydratase and apolipoprotein N-acyltransferase [Limnochorda pilosa]